MAMKKYIDQFFSNSTSNILQLIGPSGSGKSTVCIKYSTENDVYYYDPKFSVFKDTLENNILLNRSIHEDLVTIMQKKIIPDLINRYNNVCSEQELSTGQIQRINFARNILCNNQRNIIFDEPLSNVDAGMYESCLEAVQYISETTNSKFLLITHTVSDKYEIIEMIVDENNI